MVRRYPTDETQIIHPEISLTLLVAGMAAAMAMITTLCGVRSRQRSPPPEEASTPTSIADVNNNNKQAENLSPTTTPSQAGSNLPAGDTETDGEQMKELPLPPKMQQLSSSSPPNQMLKSASERKLNHMRSMSIKVPRSISFVKNQLEEGRQKRKEKIKGEESIWTKTIILGEKCKVSEEEDGVIYEGKGKKISAYHPRAHSSMSISMSRQGSAIDAEALQSPEYK